MKKLRVSDKHGFNPCLNVCFFCGKDKELLLFGKLKGDAKAPKRAMANYIPCDECKKKMANGRAVIEVTLTDTGSMPIIDGAWPTGRWCIISKESAAKLFKDGKDTPMLLDERLYEELRKATKR